MARVRGEHEGAPFAVRQGVQRLHAVEAPLHHLEHVAPGRAHALHGQKGDLQAGGLVGEHRADVAAAVAVGGRHVVLRPIPRERLDLPRGHAAFALGPLGRFGLAVLPAHDVELEVLEIDRMRVQVLLVVGAFLDPRVGYAQPQRRVGVGKHRDPLVGVHRGPVVHVGADVDLPDADLAPEVADLRGHLATPAPGRGFRVAPHEQHGVAVLAGVHQQIRLERLLAHRVHAPHVLGAPVPAFPAVGLAGLQGEAAQQVQKMRVAAVAGMHDLRLPMAVALQEHRRGPVFVDAPPDLVGADLRGLVPADALVSADPARFGMALPVGVPVDALERVRHAVLGVHALLVADRQGRQRGLEAARERVAAHGELPGIDLVLGVLVVQAQRPDARDAPVLHVHRGRVASGAEPAPAGRLVDGLVRCRAHASPFLPRPGGHARMRAAS